MVREQLLKIGLTGNEADIYLALLELGPSLVGRITQRTGINRTHIYDRLRHLQRKGLVSKVVKSNRHYFSAAEPARILRYIAEKEEAVRREREIALSLLPRLEAIVPASLESVEVYEGKEGLKNILEDILERREDVLTYGSDGNFSRVLKFSFKHYLRRFEESGMRMKVVFNHDDERKPFSWRFAEVRYLPPEFKSPTETTIYGDAVVIFIFTDKPKAVLIKSKAVARSYRSYFALLWKAGKRDVQKRK